jgi:RNA polymerase sigma-54 factor
MMTPRGTYELKYFFSQGIGSKEDGEGHAAAWVRHRIKVLVDSEAADEVLSDDNIVDFLRREGIDIARRTVAKYREALGIPSSVQRRRQKCGKL